MKPSADRRTAFQLFMDTYQLDLLTVKVGCPKCGHAWGIKVDDYNSPADIPEKKFRCACGHYGGETLETEKRNEYTTTEFA